ncbi:MAG: hypothetical protein GY711_07780 [bacterium]|nr:hypothetical protein [bacterium]
MSREGQFSFQDFTSLLSEVSEEACSGMLSVEGHHGTAQLYFTGGQLAMLADEQRDKLVDRLVDRGAITADQLEQTRVDRKGTRRALGQVLVETGVLSEDELLSFATDSLLADAREHLTHAETISFEEIKIPRGVFDPEERRLKLAVSVEAIVDVLAGEVAEVAPEEVAIVEDVFEVEPEEVAIEEDVAEVEPEEVAIVEDVAEVEPEEVAIEEDVFEVEPEEVAIEEDVFEVEPEEVAIEEDVFEVEPEEVAIEEDVTRVEPEEVAFEEDVTRVEPEEVAFEEDVTRVEPEEVAFEEDVTRVEPEEVAFEEDVTRVEPEEVAIVEDVVDEVAGVGAELDEGFFGAVEGAPPEAEEVNSNGFEEALSIFDEPESIAEVVTHAPRELDVHELLEMGPEHLANIAVRRAQKDPPGAWEMVLAGLEAHPDHVELMLAQAAIADRTGNGALAERIRARANSLGVAAQLSSSTVAVTAAASVASTSDSGSGSGGSQPPSTPKDPAIWEEESDTEEDPDGRHRPLFAQPARNQGAAPDLPEDRLDSRKGSDGTEPLVLENYFSLALREQRYDDAFKVGMRLANAHREIGLHHRAASVFERMIDQVPGHWRARLELTRSRIDNGETEEALAALVAYGSEAADNNDFETARAAVDKVLVIDPEHAGALSSKRAIDEFENGLFEQRQRVRRRIAFGVGLVLMAVLVSATTVELAARSALRVATTKVDESRMIENGRYGDAIETLEAVLAKYPYSLTANDVRARVAAFKAKLDD